MLIRLTILSNLWIRQGTHMKQAPVVVDLYYRSLQSQPGVRLHSIPNGTHPTHHHTPAVSDVTRLCQIANRHSQILI